jgi:hypothetical protein
MALSGDWPFDNNPDFHYWFLKVDDNGIFMYSNRIGCLYLMRLSQTTVELRAKFHFDASKKQLRTNDGFPIQVAKKRLIQISNGRFIMITRNDQDLPELELYLLSDFGQPLQIFKDIPNSERVGECIQMNFKSIYVLNFNKWAVLNSLLIIEIGSGERKQIPLEAKFYTMGSNFVSVELKLIYT